MSAHLYDGELNGKVRNAVVASLNRRSPFGLRIPLVFHAARPILLYRAHAMW
jgi:hypothetical protein